MNTFKHKKHTIRILPLAALLVLLVAIPFVLYTLFHASSARAEWFNSAWSYRKSIRFGNTGSAVTDQKVLIAFDTATPIAAGKMQSSCQDVRFTDAGGKLLQYYINVSGGAGVGCNDASSDFYVLMPSIVAGNNLIYIYYGNPSASAGTASANFGNTTFSPTSGPSIDAEEKSPGPVAVWHMDEGYGSTASDASGHGNSLTLTSTAWATSSATLSNRTQYLQFNGATSVASRANDTEFDFGTGSFSISAWIRHSSNITGTDVLITKYNTQGWKVYMNSSGFICFGIDDDSSYGPDDSACTTTSYADSTWHHIEVVKQGTTSITVYVDGIQKAQTTSLTATATLSTTATLYIGADSAGNTNWWDGWVDDVAIYPYARTASQIGLDMLGSSEASRSATLIGASASDPFTNGLVGYWKMDETSWNGDCSTKSVSDASGNANNGAACPNASSPSPSTGKFGLGGVFDGSDDYVLVNDANSLDVTTTFTFSAWVNASSLAAGDYYILSKDGVGSDTTGAFGFFLQAGGRVCYETNNLGDGNICSDSDAISSNGWYHVVATYNSATLNKPVFYVNGIQQDYFNTRTTVSPSALSTNLLIGRRGNSGSLFNGYIDELRIYNRSLSPSEVRQLHSWAPGPIGHWKMDENTGTSAYDSSGNGGTGSLGNGTAANMPKWKTGKIGSSLSFDGTNDFVKIPSSTLYIMPGDFTVEAWVKFDTLPSVKGTSESIVCRHVDASPYEEYCLYGNSVTDRILFTNTNTAFGGGTATTNYSISANTWYHVVGVKSGANMKIYINGSTANTTDGTFSGTLASTTGDLFIGSYDSNQNYTSGSVDDIKIYNYARTPSQIIEDMNGGHPPGGSPMESSIMHWKFDEANGATANNFGYGGSGYNGTVSGATWYPGGKVGSAIATTTSTNFVSAGDQAFVDNLTGMSIGMWIKPISLATNKALVSKSNMSSQNSFAVVTDNSASDEIRVHIPTSTSDTGTYFLTSNLNLANDTWSYVSVIYNASESASTRVRVYKDGKPISGSVTGTLPDKMTTGTTSLLKVGASDSGSYTALNAVFDDMKIYPYPLTYDQMLIDYNGKAALQLGSLSTHSDGATASNSATREFCVPGDTTSCAPPIGWWKMDENTGTTAYDSSGNGNNAVFENGLTAADWTRGKIGNGLSLIGVNKDALVSNSTLFDFGTTVPFTISAWFKIQTGSLHNTIITHTGSVAGGLEIYLSETTNTIRVTIGTSTYCAVAGTTTLNDNKWHHIEAVYNRNASCTTSDILVYIDGVRETTSVSDSSKNSNTNVDIGGIKIGSSGDTKGLIVDNLMVYNYARTPAQIAWDYNKGAPIAHYKFDECQGATVYNVAPNADGKAAGINGTITIGASGTYTSAGTCGSGTSTESWNAGTTGKFGSALAFDGTNDNVSLGDNFDFVGNSFSVCAWVYPTGDTNDGYIVGKYDVTGSKGFWLRRENNTDYTSGTVAGGGIQALNAVSLNQWQHVCSVIVPTPGTSSIYKNAVRLSSLTTVAATEDNARAMVIGDRYDGLRPFSGMIDDVRIYNYPLTQQQVRVIMNENGAVRFGP